MAVEILGSLGIDSVAIGAGSESAIICPPNVIAMQISCSAAANLRLASGGNNFRIPADEVISVDARDMPGRTYYLHNPGASSITVSVLYTHRQT